MQLGLNIPTAKIGSSSSSPVVGQRELVEHLLSVLGRTLHGAHARGLLTAVVLQQRIVECLPTPPGIVKQLLHFFLDHPEAHAVKGHQVCHIREVNQECQKRAQVDKGGLS